MTSLRDDVGSHRSLGLTVSEGSGVEEKLSVGFRSANVMSFWEFVEKPSAQEMAKIQDKGQGISACFYAYFVPGLRTTIVNETRLLGGQVFVFFLA